MHDKINAAKQILSELSTLQNQLTQFTTPTLSDTQKLLEIYQFISGQPQIDQCEIRHYFVFITVYLYSPLSVIGRCPIKAGICQQVGEVIGRCRQGVSEIFAEAKFRYENITSFRNQIETLFEQVENSWQ